MFHDPIIAQVRKVRRRLAARHGFDAHRIAEAARATESRKGLSFDANTVKKLRSKQSVTAKRRSA